MLIFDFKNTNEPSMSATDFIQTLPLSATIQQVPVRDKEEGFNGGSMEAEWKAQGDKIWDLVCDSFEELTRRDVEVGYIQEDLNLQEAS
uniref:Uncharacterized protein n=1 Tax=Nelumbo nucifera TaxID=4432 RepID=A0A822YGS7_NELNU|nr:TPA_asm: hypothetical protein HUJ06_012245 [Nelumbo nucifera]